MAKEVKSSTPVVTVESMVAAAVGQGDVVSGVLTFTAPQIEAVFAQLDQKQFDNVFTTGCGDSYFAPLATRMAFEKYTGIRCEAIQALDLSRYTVDHLPKRSMVIAISAGGDKSRTVEAMRESRLAGATTIAITGTRDSPLSREADFVIVQNEKELRAPAGPGQRTPGLANYHASLVVLYLLAFALGRRNNTISAAQRDALVAEIQRSPAIIRDTIKANDAKIRDYARSVKDAPFFQVLGGGPSQATAMFITAKMFEQPQLNGVPVQLEEWAHLQYFITRPNTPVMVVVPPGNSVDRAHEQMQGAKDMGAKVVAICDPDDKETQSLADLHFPVLGKLPEEFTPLTYCVPGELFATYLSDAWGKPASQWISEAQHTVNMRQIAHSHMRSH